MLPRLLFVLLPWCTIYAVDLSTTLSVHLLLEDDSPVEINWITQTKPTGSGDPQFFVDNQSTTQVKKTIKVVLPGARPGSYEFRAELLAGGWTVISDPVLIQVVEQSGSKQPDTSSVTSSGQSGSGCGAGTALGLLLGLLSFGLQKRLFITYTPGIPWKFIPPSASRV